jgi:transcriptional regulator with XRE-family HTH domain
MAPPRKRITNLGDALRAAREAVHFGQVDLARRVSVSSRLVSRWENGARPTPAQAERIFAALENAPGELLLALADALGIEIATEEATPAAAPLPAAPLAPPAPPPAPRPSAAEHRASFDAIIYAAAERRDVLPRHLRAFGVELLQGADRLGLSAKEAALLVALPEHGGPATGGE